MKNVDSVCGSLEVGYHIRGGEGGLGFISDSHGLSERKSQFMNYRGPWIIFARFCTNLPKLVFEQMQEDRLSNSCTGNALSIIRKNVHICSNWQIYLSTLTNSFVLIDKCIFPSWKTYLSKLINVFWVTTGWATVGEKLLCWSSEETPLYALLRLFRELDKNIMSRNLSFFWK